jgi:hypothetical protein
MAAGSANGKTQHAPQATAPVAAVMAMALAALAGALLSDIEPSSA